MKRGSRVSTQNPRSQQTGQQPARGGQNKVPGQPNGKGSWQRGRWTLLLIALVCAAPVIGPYFTYYVIKPKGSTTSYGTLIEPQRPIPAAFVVAGGAAKPMMLASLRGRWLLISVDNSACDKPC